MSPIVKCHSRDVAQLWGLHHPVTLWQITVNDKIQFTVRASTQHISLYGSLTHRLICWNNFSIQNWIRLTSWRVTGVSQQSFIFISLNILGWVSLGSWSSWKLVLFLSCWWGWQDWHLTNHCILLPPTRDTHWVLSIIRAIKETICTLKWFTKTGQNVEINSETMIVLGWYHGTTKATKIEGQ